MPSVLQDRLAAQLLTAPSARGVAPVVERLLAVQAQDPRGMRLAIRARSQGLSAADVDRALSEERSIVVTTLNRGTLHLVLARDYPWLHALTTPQLASGNARRLREEQVSPGDAERALAIVAAQLGERGALTREQLREPIAAAGIRVEGQALAHILMRAAIEGLIVRGPIVDGRHAFVLTADWLGAAPRPVDRAAALRELGRRYLAGHGPADASDLAKWAGITLGDARRALAELPPRPDGLLDLPAREPASALPAPRLLGSFDPSLHGWVSREPIVGRHTGIVTTNGIFRPFAMVAGRAVATWTLTRATLTLSELEPIGRGDRAALDADGRALLRYLGR